jgi:hypothetical protein
MKKSILFLTLIVFTISAYSQLLLVEDFDYPLGSDIKSHGWAVHSGTGASKDSILVTQGLSFEGYAGSGIGGAASVTGAYYDQHHTFTPQTSGTVYAAFMLKSVAGINSSYFIHFGPSIIGTTYFSRVWINATGTGIGLGDGTLASSTPIEIGETYLVVLKYDFASKMNSLYVFNKLPTAEPNTTNITFNEVRGPAAISPTNVGSIALRQSQSSGIPQQNVIVDGIRIGTSWEDILGVLPSVETVIPTGITNTTAVTGGNVTSAGTSIITARGVCWSQSPNPTIANSKTIDGNGTGIFSSTITGLTPLTQYYVRAYATNNAGTIYGSEVSFSTTAVVPSSFSLSKPLNGSWTNVTPLFQWATSPDALTYNLYIDDVLRKENITTTYYQILPSESITTGMHTWHVVAFRNGVSINSEETWSFRVDATPPADFDLLSPAHNTWTNELRPVLTWNASSDANSGLAKYQLWIDGVLNKDNIPISQKSTSPINDLSNGIHNWQIKAIDNVGNTKNSTQSYVIKIDNQPPASSSRANSSSMYFDGNTSYVVVPNSSSLRIENQLITIEAWVKITSYVNWASVVTKGENNSSYALRQNSGKINFSTQDRAGYNGNTTIPLDVWTHIAVTYDGSTIKFYYNGQLDGYHSVSNYLSNYSENLFIGADFPTINEFWKGYIDEVRIWNAVRTPEQINLNKDKIIFQDDPQLVAYWRFEEQAGSTVIDESNYINHGTINKSSFNSTCPSLNKLCDLKNPLPNMYINSNLPMFSWGSAPDSGIGFDRFMLFIDNQLVKDNLQDSSYTITTPLHYGKHTWYVKGFDLLGNNQASYMMAFYIDNVSPNPFNLTSPSHYQIVDIPTPNLSWQATTDSIDGSGLRKYQMWINDVVNRDSIPITQTTVSPSKALAQGAYTWYIKAYDKVGNVRQSTQTNTFYVDWEGPEGFYLISPVNNAVLTTSTPLFKWKSSKDLGSGIRKYELHISGYDPVIVQPTDTAVVLPFSLPNSIYTWYVKAFDGSGAFTSSNTYTLKIELPIPEKPALPSGLTNLCYNPANTDYIIPKSRFAESYVWEIRPSTAGTINGSDTIAVVNWTNDYTGNATISVKGYNNQGYGLSSDELSVVINPLPGNALLPEGITLVCQNSSETTYTVTPIANTNSYSWSISPIEAGTIAGNGTTVSVTWNNKFSGIASIFVKGRNECGEGLLSNPLRVEVKPLPSKVAPPTGKNSVCQGDKTVVYSTSGAEHALTYTWKTVPESAATISVDVTGKYATFDWNDRYSGNAEIVVQGQNSCGNGETSALTVTINPKPETPLIFVNKNVLSSSASSGNQWYDQNGLIEGAIESEFTVTADGEYYVVVTSSGCSSNPSDTLKVNYISGTSQVDFNTFHIYPNPVKDELFIKVKNSDNTVSNFEIINIVGTIIYKDVIYKEVIVPMGVFNPGIYFIRLETEKSYEFIRIIKE